MMSLVMEEGFGIIGTYTSAEYEPGDIGYMYVMTKLVFQVK